MHSQLALTWGLWLQKGIKKEIWKKIFEDYPRDGLVSFEAPTLNPEVLAVVNAAWKKRDDYSRRVQNAMGSTLSASEKGLTKIFAIEPLVARKELSTSFMDAGRFLTNAFYQQSGLVELIFYRHPG